MIDLRSLISTLLANHITVRFPSGSSPWDQGSSERRRSRTHIIACANLCAIHIGLVKAGYRRFLDHIDQNEDGNYRIQVFLADADAIPLIPNLVNGIVEHGNGSGFDAKAFVEDRIYELDELGALDEHHDWWDIRATKLRQKHAQTSLAE